MRLLELVGALSCLVFFSCNSATRETSKGTGASADQPALVVLISVDQMRYDFFERFGHQFEGGLKRLWEEGAVYNDAHHLHAPTHTAPGHATLSTGCFPAHHGIVANSYHDEQTGASKYCVVDNAAEIIGVDNDGRLEGRSPKLLRTSTLGDWIKSANKQSKVFAVAKKDRSSVLMGGKKADRAFWIDGLTTEVVSSDYYGKSMPIWADTLSGATLFATDLARGWHKKRNAAAYAGTRADDFAAEAGSFLPTFPHTLERMRPGMPERIKNNIMFTFTPMAEDFVLSLAEMLVEVEDLGGDDHTDLLLVGCSAADAIGHHFGPLSQEAHDYYLWLDGYLDRFFKFLDTRIGRDNYWVVLSADHGVLPLPEALTQQGIDAGRVLFSDFLALVDAVETRLEEELGLEEPLFSAVSGGIFLNYTEAESKGIPPIELRQKVANALKNLEIIADAYTTDELKGDTDRPYIQHYRNSYDPQITPDIVVRLKENHLVHGPTGTSHGSPYRYDTHVPIIFLGEPFQAGTYSRSVTTADVAPTIAAKLGIRVNDRVDGKVLTELQEGAIQ